MLPADVLYVTRRPDSLGESLDVAGVAIPKNNLSVSFLMKVNPLFCVTVGTFGRH